MKTADKSFHKGANDLMAELLMKAKLTFMIVVGGVLQGLGMSLFLFPHDIPTGGAKRYCGAIALSVSNPPRIFSVGCECINAFYRFKMAGDENIHRHPRLYHRHLCLGIDL